MCGIYGFTTNESVVEKSNILKSIGHRIEHRGPDESNQFVDDYIALGINRLSILDIKNGSQPIKSNDGNYLIIHNGEIYNYRELRENLEGLGYSFNTDTDTEVLVNLFQHKGTECLHDLNGMFVFAIYNIKTNEIFIARDRFGIKPLYFTINNSDLIFCSELKGVLEHPKVSPRICYEAIDQYLTMEYIPAPLTIYEGINKLEEGHYLIWSKKSMVKNKWYNFSYTPKSYLNSENDYIKKLDGLIHSSVKYRTISDVPLGCFLSGGLDSSLIAYYLTHLNSKPINTFNIAFEDESFDESDQAKVISEILATNHNCMVFSNTKMVELLPSIWSMMDEPLSDASLLPTYLLSQFTRDQVTVALSGDGGDEVFAGYPTYLAHKIASFTPKQFKSLFTIIAKLFPTNFDNISFDFKLKQFIRGLGYSPGIRHQYWLGSFNKNDKERGYKKEFFKLLDTKVNIESLIENHLCDSTTDNNWEKHLFQDMRFYLQDDMLVKVDRASMANSLEVRIPYLDHRIVEFMASVPINLKYRLTTSKYLLKSLGLNYFPKEIVNRSKKGFGIPIAKWFCKDLKTPLLDIANNPNSFINSIFDKQYINNLINDHQKRKFDNRKLLWTLFVLENWYNEHTPDK